MAVRDPQHNSDHYLVLGCLRSAPLREHTKYLGQRTWLPLRPPTILMREDGLFVALQRAITKPKAREATKNAWILDDTLSFIGERVSVHQYPERDHALIQRLGQAINKSLKGAGCGGRRKRARK